jgi:hypothetical protein
MFVQNTTAGEQKILLFMQLQARISANRFGRQSSANP